MTRWQLICLTLALPLGTPLSCRGDGCLRNSDCSSDETCRAGRCELTEPEAASGGDGNQSEMPTGGAAAAPPSGGSAGSAGSTNAAGKPGVAGAPSGAGGAESASEAGAGGQAGSAGAAGDSGFGGAP